MYKSGFLYKVNDSISGLYHNVPYSGKVKNTRRHTMRHDLTELSIELDNPITVYGTSRNSIIVMILDNGKEF